MPRSRPAHSTLMVNGCGCCWVSTLVDPPADRPAVTPAIGETGWAGAVARLRRGCRVVRRPAGVKPARKLGAKPCGLTPASMAPDRDPVGKGPATPVGSPGGAGRLGKPTGPIGKP
jgi:hypothetical protein